MAQCGMAQCGGRRMKGSYTRDCYILLTVIIHKGDGIYTTVEFAWLKWYAGLIIHRKSENNDNTT